MNNYVRYQTDPAHLQDYSEQSNGMQANILQTIFVYLGEKNELRNWFI